MAPGILQSIRNFVEGNRSVRRVADDIELTFAGSKSAEKRRQLEDLGASRLVYGTPMVAPDEMNAAIERLLDAVT